MAAFITFKCHNPKDPMGRVKLAKLFYLVQRKVDLTLTESFARRAAGPLDDDIHKFLPIAQKKNWIKLLPQVGMKKPVGPGDSCEEAIKQAEKYLGQKLSTVDEMLGYMKSWSGDTLECWATVDVVAKELTTVGKELSVRNVKQAIAFSPEWKDKLEKLAFSDPMIASALKGLREFGFLAK